MGGNETTNAMKAMVLGDLSTICKKLADDPAVPGDLRAEFREMVEEFNELMGDRGRDTATKLYEGEILLLKMARFLPRVVEVHPTHEDARDVA
jgi:hypothetical protein